jgi:hyperosmotically inducible protein
MNTKARVITLLLGAMGSAWAWQGPMYDRVIVNLPYPVTLQDKTLPPGPYTIEENRGQSKTNILHIFSDNGMKLEATVQTIPALDNRTPSDTRLVLERYGANYYLDKVWIQGKDYGYQFRMPENLKSLQRERAESATLPARYLRAEQADQPSGSYVATNRVMRSETTTTTTVPSGRATSRIAREVRHELVMLPYYGVFDNLAYSVDGSTVTLMGQVTRPTLKSDAENVVKRIEGVDRVINNIEVLPLSPNDDRIRMAVYRALYGDPALSRYALQAVPPIHIIVKNGNVTLAGVVASEADRNMANIRANGVPGVFSVRSELQVER